MSRNNVTASPRHLLSLEAMRGLASLWVMVGHGLSWQPFAPRQWEGIPPWWKQWLFVWSPGHLGVVLFFLLSGYVIGKAYPSDRALLPGVYVLKRFIRIWPIFAVSILLGCLVVPVSSWSLVVEALMLVRDFLPQNPVIWSVCYEFWFYLTLPLFFLVAAPRRRWLALGVALLGLFASLVGYTIFRSGVPVIGSWITGLTLWLAGLLAAWFTGPPAPEASPHPRFLPALLMLMALAGSANGLLGVVNALQLDWQLTSGRVFLLDLLFLPLSAGVFAALLGFRPRPWWFLAYGGSAGLLLLLVMAAALKGALLESGNWTASLLLGALSAGLWFRPTLPSAGWWSSSVLGLAPLGAISYGIYVFHIPSMMLVGQMPASIVLPLPLEWTARFLLAFGIVVLGSALFELRIQPRIRRRALAWFAS